LVCSTLLLRKVYLIISGFRAGSLVWVFRIVPSKFGVDFVQVPMVALDFPLWHDRFCNRAELELVVWFVLLRKVYLVIINLGLISLNFPWTHVDFPQLHARFCNGA
jgi:hypothetical protein